MFTMLFSSTDYTSTRIIKRRFFGRYFCRFIKKTAFYYPGKITFLANLLSKDLQKISIDKRIYILQALIDSIFTISKLNFEDQEITPIEM